jgi:hypothetical protein
MTLRIFLDSALEGLSHGFGMACHARLSLRRHRVAASGIHGRLVRTELLMTLDLNDRAASIEHGTGFEPVLQP